MKMIDADKIKKYLERCTKYSICLSEYEEGQLDAYISMADYISDLPDCWINVKDRMPQECENVLCYDGDLGVINVCWFSGEAVQWTDGEFVGLHVTHWMPLPEPPDKGNPF